MEEVRFVPATENDVMAIIELRKQVWITTYRGIYPDDMLDGFDYAWHKEKELQRVSSPQYSVYLIANDGGNIGYLTIRKTKSVVLQSLYVLREYQHQGIGRQAFDFAIQYCKEKNARSFICYCVPENWNARRFYEKMGGTVIGEDFGNEEHWMDSVIYQFNVQ